jgi:hypothetical protein
MGGIGTGRSIQFLDAFITKINPFGNALIYSTFLGGDVGEAGEEIAIDSAGNAYVAGTTNSLNFPVSNAIQSRSGGGRDGFVTKIDATGSTYFYSTYLGGANDDYCYSIEIDNSGYVYLSGTTRSVNFPVINSLQPSYGGGASIGLTGDGFVTKLNPLGSQIAFSTYLGGAESDRISSMAVDSDGNIYLTGFTESKNFPIANAVQSTLNGYDAFISKILIPTNSVSGRVTLASGQPLVGVQLNSSGDTQNKTLIDGTMCSEFR